MSLLLLESRLHSPEIFAYDRHVSKGQGKVPEYPHTEYGQAHAPGKVGVAMEGDGQNVPAKLDLDESLTDEARKDQPRESADAGIGVPTRMKMLCMSAREHVLKTTLID